MPKGWIPNSSDRHKAISFARERVRTVGEILDSITESHIHLNEMRDAASLLRAALGQSGSGEHDPEAPLGLEDLIEHYWGEPK